MTTARRSPLVLALVAVVAAGAIAGIAGLAYLFLRPAAPPAVGLGTASPGASGPAATIAPLPSGATSSPLPVGGTDGTWTVDRSIGSFADFSSSFVGYRVNETFADNRANEAVGRTPDVSGSLVLTGSTVTSVEISADLTTLQSDDSRRDGQLGRQGIQTDQFPTATFKLTQPIELAAVPADGGTVATTATGELTLHGVTRTVDVDIAARLSGDVVTVTGSLDILFADYGIERPQSFIVLSIEDHGIMEFQLHFRHG